MTIAEKPNAKTVNPETTPAKSAPFLPIISGFIGIAAGVLTVLFGETLKSQNASLSWIAEHRFNAYFDYTVADESYRRIRLDKEIAQIDQKEEVERALKRLYSREKLSLIASSDLITAIAAFNKIYKNFPEDISSAPDTQKLLYRDALFAIKLAMRNDIGRYYEDIGKVTGATLENFLCPDLPCLRVDVTTVRPDKTKKPEYLNDDDWKVLREILGNPPYYH